MERGSPARIAFGLGLGATLMMTGCGDPGAPELVLVGGRVWTGVPGAPPAGGVAVRAGAIAAVGGEEEIRSLMGERTRVVELAGRLLTPGFIDAHAHFIEGGFRLAAVDLRDVDTPDELARRLRERAERLPAGSWITGGDWDHQRWGGVLPDREWIDSVTPRHPVWVTRLDWHMALANTRALEAAGVPPDAAAPEGGEIVRDPSGRMTGIFKDEAMALVAGAIPAPTETERDEALRAAMPHAAARGVTGVHDMGSWEDLATWRRARERGELTLRAYAFVPLSGWRRLAEEVGRVGGPGDEWLRFGGVKGFVDGSLGSGTAAFEEPYEDDPANRGLFVTPPDSLRAWVRAADSAGLHVAVHAIGDRANGALLDLYAEVAAERGGRDRRWRVEHAQHLRPEDIPRFAGLGAIPSMQPYHAIDDGRWAEAKIGARRAATTYAFRSLLDAGARPAFGSDWTVAPLDPLLGIHAAVTRSTLDGAHTDGWVPEEKVGLEEALAGYTRHAARAGFAEGYAGTLEPGKRADLVVIAPDLFSIPPEAIARARVDLTVVDGRIVFEREGSAPAP